MTTRSRCKAPAGSNQTPRLRAPLIARLSPTASSPVLAWGRDWAEANYPDTWKHAKLEGTVLEKMPNGKWKCDFQEDDPADRGCFLRKALTLVSRPGGIVEKPVKEKKKRASGARKPKSAAAATDSSDEEGGAKPAARADEEADEPAEDPDAPFSIKAARGAIAEIMAASSGDLSGLSTKKVRLALEEKWGMAVDELKLHRRQIDNLVLARAEEIEAEKKRAAAAAARAAVRQREEEEAAAAEEEGEEEPK